MENAVTSTEPLLVAIDGPAGSGKSSVSRAAADRLGFGILDTGAGYRALAWAMRAHGTELDDELAALEMLRDWRFKITMVGAQRVTVELPAAAGSEESGEVDVTAAIRDHEISGCVSRVSRHPEVRVRLNALFRELVANSELPGVVIEGRDTTTVIAPDAPVRILLTASPEVRAARRAGELPGLSPAQVLEDLHARDAKDALVVDFFTPAPGVTLVDTSDMSFEQSVQAVVDVVQMAQEGAR